MASVQCAVLQKHQLVDAPFNAKANQIPVLFGWQVMMALLQD
jgi:hypothetical protein